MGTADQKWWAMVVMFRHLYGALLIRNGGQWWAFLLGTAVVGRA